jgi:hypothetical protein
MNIISQIINAEDKFEISFKSSPMLLVDIRSYADRLSIEKTGVYTLESRVDVYFRNSFHEASGTV